MKNKKESDPRGLILLVLIAGLIAAYPAWRYVKSLIHQEPAASTQVASKRDAFVTTPGLDIARNGGVLVHSDGSLWIWGARGDFIGPDTKPELRHQAKRLGDLDRVVSASLTPGYVLAVRDDGSVWGMGNNAGGQMGMVIPSGAYLTNDWIEVKGLRDVAQVLSTRAGSLVLKKDRTVWISGSNKWNSGYDVQGRLGENFEGKMSNVHVQLPHLSDIVHLEASEYHDTHYALRGDGKVLVWGSYMSAGLPYYKGHPDYVLVPQVIPELENVKAITGGRGGIRSILAQRDDGSVALWYGNGLQSCDGEYSPTFEVPEFKGAVSIALAVMTIYAVMPDGSFWSYVMEDVTRPGCGRVPQQLLPPDSARAIATAGLAHALLMRDGSVVVWGSTLGIESARDRALELTWERREKLAGLSPVQFVEAP